MDMIFKTTAAPRYITLGDFYNLESLIRRGLEYSLKKGTLFKAQEAAASAATTSSSSQSYCMYTILGELRNGTTTRVKAVTKTTMPVVAMMK